LVSCVRGWSIEDRAGEAEFTIGAPRRSVNRSAPACAASRRSA